MDAAFTFFVVFALLCAALMTIFVVSFSISLVRNDQQDAARPTTISTDGRPIRRIILWMSFLGPIIIVLTSLTFGAVIGIGVLAVQWCGQNAPWVFLIAILAVLVWASLDGVQERRLGGY